MTKEEKINLLKAIIQECEEYQWWRKATLSEIIEDLKQEPKWTLVSEKLPDNDGYYRVIEKSDRVGTYVFHKEGNSEEYWKRCAVAWMPLPGPYKAESEK